MKILGRIYALGLSKEKFHEFTKYYDEDVFKGVAHSIRAKAFDCDDLLPTERVQAIAEIFSIFKNQIKKLYSLHGML